MADDKEYSTYAVKLDGEVKQELQSLLEGYKQETGTNAGDFIKTLLEVYKTNKIVSKVSSTDTDIKELNTLTSRIYSIYSNLIERNKSNNDSLQLEFSEQLNQKDSAINNIKIKLQDMEQEQERLKTAYNNLCEDKTELEKENNQLNELNDSYKLNVSKLQEENNGLLELKEVNKRLLSEVEEYKKLLADSQSKNIELSNSIKEKDSTIGKLNNEVEAVKLDKETKVQELNTKHSTDIEAIKEKTELQKDKALLELRTKHQQEQQELQHKNNEEIQEYQKKYKELLEELEQMKKNTHSNNTRNNNKAIKKQDNPNNKV